MGEWAQVANATYLRGGYSGDWRRYGSRAGSVRAASSVEVSLIMVMRLLGLSRDRFRFPVRSHRALVRRRISLTGPSTAVISVSAALSFYEGRLGKLSGLYYLRAQRTAFANYAPSVRPLVQQPFPGIGFENLLQALTTGLWPNSDEAGALLRVCLLLNCCRDRRHRAVHAHAIPRGDPSALTRCALMSSCAAASIRPR